MTNDKGKLTGILGTIILHLVAGIIFMSLQLSTLQKKISAQYEVELIAPQPEPEPQKEQAKEVTPSTVEKVLKDDAEMLNIAKNLASKPTEKINAADYIDKVKEELIKSGKLGADNFIDEQKNQKETSGDESIINQKDTIGSGKKKANDEAQLMASNYKGATRIYYDLLGRHHVHLPIPIYKCEGSGKVVLSIEVDQRGNVQKAQIVARESTASDPCLIETAINTALESTFNPDVNSPRIQIGMLTYQFVAQ